MTPLEVLALVGAGAAAGALVGYLVAATPAASYPSHTLRRKAFGGRSAEEVFPGGIERIDFGAWYWHLTIPPSPDAPPARGPDDPGPPTSERSGTAVSRRRAKRALERVRAQEVRRYVERWQPPIKPDRLARRGLDVLEQPPPTTSARPTADNPPQNFED